MTERDQKIIEEEFGVTHMADPELRKAVVRGVLGRMSPSERTTIQMRIGRKAREAEGMVPGRGYSPKTVSLIFVAIFMSVLAPLALFAAIFPFPALVRITMVLAGAWWLLVAWRTVARIIFRIANGRDI